jgi:DNA (cytosine-5)-methyltransferase 1
MKVRKKKPVFIDLFAGAGGMSIGLEQAGFKLVAATDWDHWSCETLRTNHPDILVKEGDIVDIDLYEFERELNVPEIDLIVGGPPCQGFSQLGKQQKNDPRNQLWRHYMRFVEHFKPKIFLMENVPQLLTSDEYVQIKEMATALGYSVKEKVLHAVDYGVPQKRKRTIIIGSRIGSPAHPTPTHIDPTKVNLLNRDLKLWRTVRDAIGDLPKKPTGENWHVGRNPTPMSLERYKCVPEGGNRFDLPEQLKPDCWKKRATGSTDVFGRLSWDKPALTIRTEFFKPEKGRYLHPKEHRPITIREAARIQTFPDNYIIVGSNVQAAKQIGNAVPAELARNIGLKLLELLNAPVDSFGDEIVDRSARLERQLA